MRAVRHIACVFALVLSDTAAFALAALLFRSGRVVPEIHVYWGILPGSGTVDLFFAIAALFIVLRYAAEDYSRRQLFWDGARLTTISLLFCSLPCLLLLLFTSAPYSAFAIVGSWSFAIAAIPGFRQATRWLLCRLNLWQLRSALIGNGETVVEAYQAFRHSLSLGFDVKAIVACSSNGEEINSNLPEEIRNLMLYRQNDPDDIVSCLNNTGCQEAIIVGNDPAATGSDRLVQRLMALNIGVAVIPSLRRLPLLGITTNFFIGHDILVLHVRNNLNRLPSVVIKRLCDFVVAAVMIILISPCLLLIAYLIRRCDGGPVFFGQRRVGRDGKNFTCYKFRTMRVDAEQLMEKWKRTNDVIYQEYVLSNFKLRNDPRVTPIGRYLRKNSLDELPQLINVLFGQMSLVGPRPLLPHEVPTYGSAIELYNMTRPGITGLWQISGRSHTTFIDRATSDEWYIKNWSLWYDFVILMRTIEVLCNRDGAY